MSRRRKYTYNVQVTQIDLVSETEYDLQVDRMVRGKPVARVFPVHSTDSPRCDSLSSLQDVIHDVLGDAIWSQGID